MKRCLIAAVLGLACATASAAEWIKVNEADGLKLSMDAESVIPKGSNFRLWTKAEFSIKRKTKTGTTFDKVVTYQEINCAERQSAILSASFYDGEKHVSTTNFSKNALPDFDPIIPDTGTDAIAKAVCSVRMNQ